MEKLKYIRPTKEYEKEALEYIREFIDYNSKTNGSGKLDEYINNYDGWLENLESIRNIKDDTNSVPSETFMLIRESDNKLIGMTNIRLKLNDKLQTRGGHIGYGVRPTERRKGYNSYQFYLALEFCKEKGIDRVLMTCDKKNIDSAKTIENNGGILENEIPDSKDSSITVQRYWIDVDDTINKLRKKYKVKK